VPRPTTKETWHKLSDEQLATTLEFARLREPGRYTLREIHGDQWQFVWRPRRYGVLFKRAVVAGTLAGIRWIGRKSNKSLLYEVFV
jgi:hypothetical protein